MPSAGTNHGWRTAEGPKWGDRVAGERRGRGEARQGTAVGCAAVAATGERRVCAAVDCGRG